MVRTARRLSCAYRQEGQTVCKDGYCWEAWVVLVIFTINDDRDTVD